MRTFFLIATGLVLTALGIGRVWFDVDAVRAVSQSPASQLDRRLARQVLAELTRGRGLPFQDHWQVNPPLLSAGLRVYLFDSGRGPPAPLRPYVKNCGFTGHRATIICDTKIIDTMQLRWVGLTIADPKNSAYLDSRLHFRKFILTWLFAHELGHITAGHGASRFAHGPLDDYVDDASASEKKEMDADAFAVTLLGKPNMHTGDDYYRDVIGAFNEEILISTCPRYLAERKCEDMAYSVGIILPRDPRRTPLAFCVGGSHPDFIVRTIRLLKIAQDKYHMMFFGQLIEEMYHRDLRAKLGRCGT